MKKKIKKIKKIMKKKDKNIFGEDKCVQCNEVVSHDAFYISVCDDCYAKAIAKSIPEDEKIYYKSKVLVKYDSTTLLDMNNN